MAYTKDQFRKRVAYVMEVYNSVKEADIPDSRIIRHIFPKHNIFITRRTFVNYKAMKPSEYREIKAV